MSDLTPQELAHASEASGVPIASMLRALAAFDDDPIDPRQAERDWDDDSLDAFIAEEQTEDRARTPIMRPLFQDPTDRWWEDQL